jgi:hypothetical protein
LQLGMELHYRCWEWEAPEFGCGSHCHSLEHDKAGVRELCFEHIDEAGVLEEEASLDPIVDLARVLCDVETDAKALVREHGGGIAQKEQEIRLDNGMVVQEMELCNEKAVQERELCNELVVLGSDLYIEMAVRERALCIEREELEMALDGQGILLVTQL